MTGSGIPYHNLILTGYMGVGKIAVGRAISTQLGVPFIDLPTEIHLREGSSPAEIRELFGEARVRALESELCRELALRRSAVISLSGQTLLDTENRERLLDSGPMLVLTCALNEILRRLHSSQGARFHDPEVRAAALSQVRAERQIHQLENLVTLDTTYLSIEVVVERAIAFWYAQETITI